MKIKKYINIIEEGVETEVLIPIDEIYFKEKVKIKFDNIIQGFNNYKALLDNNVDMCI